MKPLLQRLKPGRYSAIGLLVVVCAVAGLAWFAGSSLALRTLVEHAVTASGGKLAATGVHGTLFGSVRIDHLRYADAFQQVDAQDVELGWSLRELLLQQRLQMDRLQVRQLDVDILKLDPDPWQVPQSMRLPMAVAVPDARITRLVVTYKGQSHDLGELGASLDNLGRANHLTARVQGAWGKADAALDLSPAAPFALNGSLDIEAGVYSAHAQVGGSLSTIALAAKLGDGVSRADAQAELTPFEKSLLHRVALQAQAVDPRRYAGSLPQARLSLDIALQADATEGFAGSLKVANAQPGPIDQDRLPLKTLDSEVRGNIDTLALSRIRLDLGEAGLFAGAGNVHLQKMHLDLTTASFNLHGLAGTLKPTRLSGNLHLDLEQSAQSLRASLAQQDFVIDVDAVQRGGLLEVRQAHVHASGSALSLTGSLPLAGKREYQLQGELRDFNPQRFGQYPEAAINARFSASGKLRPELQSTLQVTIADSSYRGQALSGQGNLQLEAQRIHDVDVHLNLASNRLDLRGAYGQPPDSLQWKLDAPAIAALGTGFAGEVQGSGTLEGNWKQPAGQFSLSATRLDWNGKQQVARLDLSGKLDNGLDGKLELHADLENYRGSGIQLEHASLSGHGQRSQHELELTARNPALDLHAVIAGGWLANNNWSGEIRSLENRGFIPLHLQQPAHFAFSADSLSLQNALCDIAGATLRIDTLAWSGGKLSSHGNIQGLNPINLIKRADKRAESLDSTLTLGAKWSIDAGDRLNATMDFWREQGDLALPGELVSHLGINQLTGSIVVADDRLLGKLDMQGTAVGHVTASIDSSLQRAGRIWTLQSTSPLQAHVNASMPSLAWIAPLLGARTRIDGAIEMDLSAGGTISQPDLDGTITGDKLNYSHPGQGVYLKDGKLRATLHQNHVTLEQFELHGKEGRLDGSGSASLDAGKVTMQLQFAADKLQVMDRPDRQLTLSGNGTVSLSEGLFKAAARLKADKANITLGKGDTPTLDSDVQVLGRDQSNAPSPPRIALDLNVDLGDHFSFKGDGIEARLTGNLTLTGKSGTLPATTGTISVAEGTYFAYGQPLSIDRGILNFSGPIDNPGLNILAMRKNQPVEAGVTLSGTMLQPHVVLTSDPVVPDGDKLSWLVLGHGLAGSSGSDLGLLQSAANALLSNGSSLPLQNRIAHAAGLDEVTLSGTGGMETSVVTVGKRLSSRAYLSYEQGLTGISSFAKITYTLTKRLSIKAQAGTESALDLIYDFSFH